MNHRIAHALGLSVSTLLPWLTAGCTAETYEADEAMTAGGDADIGSSESDFTGSAIGPNTARALEYGHRLVGAPYSWWTDGMVLGEGAPAWAANAEAPYASQVREQGTFCAGVPNLLLRLVGKSVPDNGIYSGGTRAYYNRYYDVSHWVKADMTYPPGTLFIRNYRMNDDGTTADQGHVAVMGLHGLLLQSWTYGWPDTRPGVTADTTFALSNEGTSVDNPGNFYEIFVYPQDWLE